MSKLISPPLRGLFVSLAKARAFEGSTQEPKFEMTLLIPKDSEFLKAIQKAIKTVAEEKWGKKPVKFKYPPLKELDTEKYPVAEGHYAIKLSSKDRPKVVDKDYVEMDPQDCYSGGYYRCSFEAYAWNNKLAGDGVSFGLNNVMFWKDGERLGASRAKPEEDFGGENSFNDLE
jgi:Protein of unknown function (DUF2815)